MTFGYPDTMPLAGQVAVLATMHGKEQAISPVLEKQLGVRIVLPHGLDTDMFGTFTRETPRAGTQLEAARFKAQAGLEIVQGARIAVASEGSFASHPQLPLVPLAREIVLLVDRHTGLELVGTDESVVTNYGHVLARDRSAALNFATRAGFPAHGLVVMAARDELPTPTELLIKDIADESALLVAVDRAIAHAGAAFVEADMRAHRNPTRMAAIARAAENLVERFASRCPACGMPGFGVVEPLRGLPCRACGSATMRTRGSRLCCAGCGHEVVRPVAPGMFAEPYACSECNP